MSQAFRLQCPSCGTQLNASTEALGKVVPCPKCSKPTQVPSLEEFRHAARAVAPSKPQRRPGEISIGAAGFVLVCCRLLQIVGRLGKGDSDVFWFIGAFAALASLVGLVISIVGIAKNSGRTEGIFGVVGYVILAVLFMALRI